MESSGAGGQHQRGSNALGGEENITDDY